MSNSGKDVWYEGDHVRGGTQALIDWGYPREDFRMASAGYNDAGEPQVLALGSSHLWIVNRNGGVVVEVAHRQVRGVRSVAGMGVQVHVAPGPPSRQRMWIHVVADHEAKYLEDTWLITRTHQHNGVQLNPLHWKEEDYAYYVGRVITEGARCDSTLIGLALIARPLLGLSTKGIYGSSGSQLGDALKPLGKISPPLEDLRERYLAWYKKRNLAAHGFRRTDPDGRPLSTVYKPKKGRSGQPPEVLFEAEEQDFADLARIWSAFYSLNHDAAQASSHLIGAAHLTFPVEPPTRDGTIKILKGLPRFNSVSDSQRLPPSSSDINTDRTDFQ